MSFKPLLALTVLLGVSTLSVRASDYYVAPTDASPAGASSHSGTQSSPWDLQTALSNSSGTIQPGDTIWMRGGVYKNPTGIGYVSKLQGSDAAHPITLRQMPGEKAIIETTIKGTGGAVDGVSGVGGSFVITGAYANFWGFEYRNAASGVSRAYMEGSGPRPASCDGIKILADHVKFINLTVHDATGSAFGTHTNVDVEISGCVLFNNGVSKFEHGIYSGGSGQTSGKVFTDNVVVNNASVGITLHGESGEVPVENTSVYGNTIVGNGVVYNTVTGNRNFDMRATSMINVNVHDNYMQQMTFDRDALLDYKAAGSVDTRPSANIAYKNNYHTAILDLVSTPNSPDISGNVLFDDGAGLTTLHVFVRPNTYQPGRAHVTVYNWNGDSTLTLTSTHLGSAGAKLEVGKQYEIRDAQDFLGAPIATFTYNGTSAPPITLPGSGSPVAQYVLGVHLNTSGVQDKTNWRPGAPGTPNTLAHTSNKFACLVILPVDDDASMPPAAPTSLTATATSATEIDLSWAHAADGSIFEIERKQGVGSYGFLNYAGANSTTYEDTTVSAATSYTYHLRAINDAGQSDWSNEASATTNNPDNDTIYPTVSITAPTNNAMVTGNAVPLVATAADNVGVVGVQFKLDGTVLGSEDTVEPYTINWDTSTVSDGSHTLTAVARDAAGNSTTSASVSVTVDNAAPTVSITAPSANATVSGTSVAVSADASDTNGVVGVQFMLDGLNLLTEDTSSPYGITWDTTSCTNGTHTLTAVARDAAGILTTSSAISVTVNNNPVSPLLYDANDLIISASSGDSTDTVANSGANRGDFLRYNSDATNDYATFTVNIPATGTYNVSVRYRVNKLFGICQLQIDGVNRGSAQDLYASSSSFATFDLGSVSLASGNRAFKFQITGKNAAAGDYQFGLDTITLTPASGDSIAPTVSMASPVAGTLVGGTVTITADASDNVGVAGVQFKLDGIAVGLEDSTAPYSIDWDTTGVTEGSHSLTAVARDAAGNSTTSSAVAVTVDHTAPSVSITAPSNNATVSGTSVTVSATASDNNAVAAVQFKLDGANLGIEDTTAPYSITWNTTTASNGVHTLTAVVQDAAGNMTTSSGVTVTVTGASPIVYDINALTISASSGDSTDVVSDSGASGNNFLRYNSDATNDYATFTVNVATAGTYNVSVRYRINQLFGICQLQIDGVNQGAAKDLYTSTGATFTSFDLGSVALASGNRAFKFKITGKNASAGDYQFAIDTITLTPGGSGDTTAPTISITSPTNSQTVTGTVSVAVNAADNVGVVGVQFKLDGVNLGSEDTVAPFTINWDTTTASAGSHTLTAVARDAAGNTTTSSGVTVTVGSASPVVYDINALTISASSGDSTDVVSNSDASGNNFLRYNSNATNDYATFTVNVAAAGSYNVSVKYRINQLYGICQLQIDGVNQGAAKDLYTSGSATFTTFDLGSVSLSSGNRAFKFKITGKNASAGDYQFAIDTITLTPN